MMNPAKLIKIKGMWDKFTGNHPKLIPFFNAVNKKGIKEGTLINAKVTFEDGKEYNANIRVTSDDVELFEQIRKMNS